jgi:hypothetical protein
VAVLNAEKSTRRGIKRSGGQKILTISRADTGISRHGGRKIQVISVHGDKKSVRYKT